MVGKRIKDAREAIPMSQKEFADALKVTPRAVQKWEANDAEPHPKNIRAMATLTGRDAAYFLGVGEPEAVA